MEPGELAVGTGAAELLVTLVDAATDDEAEAGLVEAGLVDAATDDEAETTEVVSKIDEVTIDGATELALAGKEDELLATHELPDK